MVWCGVVTRFAAETGHDKLKQVCTLLLCHGLSRNSTKSRTNKASTILSLFFFLSLSLSFSLSLSLSLSHSNVTHSHKTRTQSISLSFLSLLSLSHCLSIPLSSLSLPLFHSPSLTLFSLLSLSLWQLCLIFHSLAYATISLMFGK